MLRDQARFLAMSASEHMLTSEIVSETFRIRVVVPIRRADALERFPTLYFTDGDDFGGAFATMTSMLQAFGEIPRVILVGIGYQNSGASELLRMRDFFPRDMRQAFRREIEEIARSPFVSNAPALNDILEKTDSTDFLRFVLEELVPFIDSRYPTQIGERHYFGYSAGATVGVQAVLQQPTAFKTYVLGSPATAYGDVNYLLPIAAHFSKADRDLPVKVFLSVGELEEFRYPHLRMVTGFYALVTALRELQIPNLQLISRVFAGETHATAWPLAFHHGLKSVLGPALEVPFWPQS